MSILLEESMKFLYERGDMSFAHIKESILKSSKLIKLSKKKKEPVDPKTGKKILLSFSSKEGKVKLARNVSEAKKGGCSLVEACKEYGTMQESFRSSIAMLERKLHSLSLEEQKKLFGDNASKYYKVQPVNLFEKSCKRKNYDTKHFIIEKNEVIETSQAILEDVKEQCSLMENFINEWQGSMKSESFSIHENCVRYLNECSNGNYANTAVNKINSNLSSVNSLIGNKSLVLDDGSTIDDYMLARIYVLLNGMLDGNSKSNFDPYVKMNIAKKLLGVGGISVPDIMRNVPEDKKQFIKENILNNDSKKEILSNAISPIQNTIFDYISDNLKTIKGILFLYDTPESSRMSKYIDSNLKLMSTGNTVNTYKNILSGMRKLDQHLKTNNSFEFDYDGMTYQPMFENFPIKQMTEMLKFAENNDKISSKPATEEKVLEIKDINSIVNEMAVSSGAISFGAVPTPKIRRKKKKWIK